MSLKPLEAKHRVPEARLDIYRSYVAQKIYELGFCFDEETRSLSSEAYFQPYLHPKTEKEIEKRWLSERTFFLKLYEVIDGVNELATNHLIGWMISGEVCDSHPGYTEMFPASTTFVNRLADCFPGNASDLEKQQQVIKALVELTLRPMSDDTADSVLHEPVSRFLESYGIYDQEAPTPVLLYYAAQQHLLENLDTQETFVIKKTPFFKPSISGTYSPENGNIYNRYDLAHSRRHWFNFRASLSGLMLSYGCYSALALNEVLLSGGLVCLITAFIFMIRDGNFLKHFRQRYGFINAHELVHEAQTSKSSDGTVGKVGLVRYTLE